MLSGFERRVEQFQFKIQQKINLADDEISRLMTDLALVNGGICEITDQINRIGLKIAQTSQEAIGRDKRYQASIDTMVAKMKAAHNKRLQEIQYAHDQEVLSLHKDFEETMKEVQKHSEKVVKNKTSDIDNMIFQTKSTLKNMKNDYKSSSFGNDDSFGVSADLSKTYELEIQRQKQLEKTIQKRNQERLDSMLQGKARLAECVATLEEMEANHTAEMENNKLKLDTLDQRYQDQIKREKDRHRNAIDSLNRKLNDYNQKIESYHKSIHKIERHHKLQIDSAVREGESIQQSEKSSSTSTITSSYANKSNMKVQEYYSKLERLKDKLSTRENELISERTENESLKREIARLKHEANAVQRRKARSAYSSNA